MSLGHIDVEILERLRSAFLSGDAGKSDYWRSRTDLECYDRTFARRIAWKWRYVFSELRRLEWMPPESPLFDWGCGTGVASREFLREFDSGKATKIFLFDRSLLALDIAEQKLRDVAPSVPVEKINANDLHRLENIGVLLVSHVLTELDSLEPLIALATKASAVIWVDAGTYECSRRLIAAREALRTAFRVVAPCAHNAPCGMLDDTNAKHWCHHFAESPQEVFTDGGWTKFGALMGIDLRRLPLSYLALDKRPAPPTLDKTGATRLIGQARMRKAHADLLCCSALGVSEKRLSKRAFPEAFRRLSKDDFPTLQNFLCDSRDVIDIQT